MSIPFVIKIVIRLILLTCIGSLVLKKAAKKAAVPTAMRQGSKESTRLSWRRATTGHRVAWVFVGGDADWSEVNGSKTSYDEGVMLEDGIETTKTEQIAA